MLLSWMLTVLHASMDFYYKRLAGSVAGQEFRQGHVFRQLMDIAPICPVTRV